VPRYLRTLDQKLGRKAKYKNISLDAYIISATPFDELRKRYDDGTWDRRRFAEKHILFSERTSSYDYMKILFGDVDC